jgi:T5SS/PEP-CTERM-associated repeat protein
MAGLTISSNTIGLVLTSAADNPLTIASGVTVSSSAGAAIYSNLNVYWSIANGGTLLGTNGYNGIELTGGSVSNAASGQISGYAAGVYMAGAGTVVNQGGITANQTAGSGFSYNSSGAFIPLSAGVLLGAGGVSNAAGATISAYLEGVAIYSGGSVSNAGQIAATSNQHGFGVVLPGGGTVANAGSGWITGGVDGILSLDQPVTVANQGLITGGDNYGIVLGVGGLVSNASTGTIVGAATGLKAFNGAATVTNQGQILGSAYFGVVLGAGGSIDNQTTATIAGGIIGVRAFGAAATVTNQGQIEGQSRFGVLLDSGGTIVNQAGGTIETGSVYAGRNLRISGIQTYNTYDVSITNASGGVVEGVKYGVFAYGRTITLTNAGVVAGTSVVGAVLLAPSSLTNGATGTIAGRYDAIYAAGTGASTIINDGILIGSYTAGAWLQSGGSVTNQSAGEIYAEAVGIKVVNAAGTVTNAGSIHTYQTGSAAGVQLAAGGVVTNSSGGYIGAEYIGVQFGTIGMTTSVAGSLFNQGTIYASNGGSIGAALWMHGPASVYNAAGGAIEGGPFGVVAYYQTTIVNHGSIGGWDYDILVKAKSSLASTITNNGVIGGGGQAAVWLDAGGTITNATLASITGGNYGVYTGTGGNGLSTLVNSGSLTGTTIAAAQMDAGGVVTNNATGAISSGGFGVRIAAAAGTVWNAGRITSSATAHAAGVQLEAGGVVSNTASGHITGAYIGVQIGQFGSLVSGSGTVINQGTIHANDGTDVGAGIWLHGPASVSNTTSGVITGGPFGIVAYYQTTIVNQGSIGGGAFAFDPINPGFADRIVDAPGAVFSGIVSGGNALGSTIASTLELASAATAGTLTGLGTQFIDFAQVTLDAGASWLLTGTNTLAAGATLTGSGTLALSVPLLNTGTIDASGGTLDVAGGLAGTGALDIANAAVLRLDSPLAAGQSISFNGTSELILNAPGTAFSNAITGLATGDRIEFGSGMTAVSAAVLNTHTIAVTVETASGTVGTYDLTDVAIAPGSGQHFSVGTDTSSGDSFIQVVATIPRTLVWTGATSTSLATASNWNDTTDSLDPAAVGPNALDTVLFANPGGAIVGTGTAAAITFDGGGAWQLGSGASLGTAGTVVVGESQATSLLIDQGSSLSEIGSAVIADTQNADGSQVSVTGTNSIWRIGTTLVVGNAGDGLFSLSQGATVTAGGLDAAVTGSAVISLSGAGTDLALSGDGIVADNGSATLSILNGATMTGTDLTVGSQGNASGALTVSDTGSVLRLSGTLYVGTAEGTGELTVGPNATIIATSIQQQGQVVLEGGLLDPNVIVVGVGYSNGGYGTAGGTGDLIDNDGTLLAAAGSKSSQKVQTFLGTIVGQGIMQINAGSTLEVGGPVLSGDPSVDINNDGTPVATPSSQDVVFSASTGVLKLDDIGAFAGTIGTYVAGDQFIITGGVLSGLGVSGGTVLTVNDSGNGGVDQIAFAAPISAGQFSIVGGNTIEVVQCFAAGTLIQTERGPVAVERLRAGDQVVTAEDGRLEPVVWLGRRAVDCAMHPRPAQVWPIRVRKGAFGPQRPARDLFLSPDHAVFVNEVLVPVKYLVNGTSIGQVRRKSVVYYHVELPRHALLLAEGLAVESYLDVGDRSNFQNGGGVVALFPDFTSLKWETEGCAPLVVCGAELDAARAMVREPSVRSSRRVARPRLPSQP